MKTLLRVSAALYVGLSVAGSLLPLQAATQLQEGVQIARGGGKGGGGKGGGARLGGGGHARGSGARTGFASFSGGRGRRPPADNPGETRQERPLIPVPRD